MASQKKIRESLTAQLRAKGADLAHFESLVEDYVMYYAEVQKMKMSIRKKGLTYEAMSAAGKLYEKDNPAAKLLPVYTRSMLSILKDLGLTTDQVIIEGDDEL